MLTDLERFTYQQKHAWERGDFREIGITVTHTAERIVEMVDPHANQRVLDVGCSTGNTAIVAARRYCDVVGVDIAPTMLKTARTRAEAEGVQIDFRVADMNELPFEDASFDAVLSTFGVMFSGDQERTAKEILRVCKPGGKIGLINWPPSGTGGEMLDLFARYSPPNPFQKQPLTRWGTEQGIRELLGEGTSSLHMELRKFVEYFRDPAHLVRIYQTTFGPGATTFKRVGPERAVELAKEMTDVLNRHNVANDGTLMLECEYMEVVATRK